MGVAEIKMPRMGESVIEGTILKWLKEVGEVIEEDESLLEVGTDKVDTEIPSPYTGKIVDFLAKEGEVIPVGQVIAKIETEQVANEKPEITPKPEEQVKEASQEISVEQISDLSKAKALKKAEPTEKSAAQNSVESFFEGENNNGFFSPLVLNIAKNEGIPLAELASIPGTGENSRLTKNDLLEYIKVRSDATHPIQSSRVQQTNQSTSLHQEITPVSSPAQSFSGAHDIMEMDRTRQIIAERMLESKRTSPHVTSFVEADVTNIVYWRNRWKHHFKEKENAALTFTPIFAEAVVKALRDYPMMNVSVDGKNIIVKKDINLGVAVALQDGNLVVPVIHEAQNLNLVGLTKKVNDVAKRARSGRLTADDLQGGTYTISNMGSFGNVMGTPILVQPQVGILALGAVVKKPAVVETPNGDTIGIRHMMFLSHTYDHRVVDGALGGMFVRRVADYLEKFDLDREV